MLGHSLRVARKIADFVPHPAIRIKRQAADGNTVDEIARRGEQLLDQSLVFGEEQNIAHEAANGLRGRQFINAVLRTLLQEKKRGDGSRAVLASLSQFSGERSSEG